MAEQIDIGPRPNHLVNEITIEFPDDTRISFLVPPKWDPKIEATNLDDAQHTLMHVKPVGEALCEVNGVPVLVKNEEGKDEYSAPHGLEGIAAYFEARGTPEDVYPMDRHLGENFMRHQAEERARHPEDH